MKIKTFKVKTTETELCSSPEYCVIILDWHCANLHISWCYRRQAPSHFRRCCVCEWYLWCWKVIKTIETLHTCCKNWPNGHNHCWFCKYDSTKFNIHWRHSTGMPLYIQPINEHWPLFCLNERLWSQFILETAD